MFRARRSAVIAGLLLAATLLVPYATAGAQGVPAGTGSATGAAPGAAGTVGAAGTTTFRCPGVTEVSATADSTAAIGKIATTTVIPISPAEAAESPCVLPGSEPDIEWSADYVGLRLTSPGTWR